MNIDKMEAGPMMDVLIVEKVFGWEWDHSNPLQSILFSPGGDIGAVKFHEDNETSEQIRPMYAPPCSTNNSWAINALREFKTPYQITGDSQSVVVRLTMRDSKRVFDIFGYGGGFNELPLAICRALLKAVQA